MKFAGANLITNLCGLLRTLELMFQVGLGRSREGGFRRSHAFQERKLSFAIKKGFIIVNVKGITTFRLGTGICRSSILKRKREAIFRDIISCGVSAIRSERTSSFQGQAFSRRSRKGAFGIQGVARCLSTAFLVTTFSLGVHRTKLRRFGKDTLARRMFALPFMRRRFASDCRMRIVGLMP